MNALNKLAAQFSHFFLGTLLMQLIGLFSFPILTRVLTREQYGILGLVTITMMVSVAISKAGLADAVIRFYQEWGDSPERLTEFASTVLFRGMILAVGTMIVYLIAFPSLGKILGIKQKYLFSFMIMGGYLLIRPINIIVMYFLRVNDRTVFLNIIFFIERAVSVTLGLILLIFFIHDLYGYFLGVILAELIIAVILYQWFFRKYTVNIRKTSNCLNTKLLRFGIPLLFSEILYLFMTYADRYLIVAFLDEGMLGLYSVGYNLAMYIGNIFVFSLSYSIVPIYVQIYEKKGKKYTQEFLKKVYHYFIMLLIPVFFGYWGLCKELLIILAGEKYVEAAGFSPLILGGTLVYAMTSILNAGLYLQKKTLILLLIMACAVGMNISMNYFLIPRYGIFGGALTAMGTFSMMSILTAIFSFRYIAIRPEICQVIYYLFLSSGMFMAIIFIHFENIGATLFMKLGLGSLIIGLGIFYREKEFVKIIKNAILERKGRELLDDQDITIRARKKVPD